MSQVKRWYGTFPFNCNWCGIEVKKPDDTESGAQVFYDACIMGRWGLFCPACFKQLGGKLGIMSPAEKAVMQRIPHIISMITTTQGLAGFTLH